VPPRALDDLVERAGLSVQAGNEASPHRDAGSQTTVGSRTAP
jgi:hypothetical protein